MTNLNILYACDDNYAPFAGVSMLSLFENNRDMEKITVYLMLDHVSEENLKRLYRTSEAFGHRIVVIPEAIIEKVLDFLRKNNLKLYRGSFTAYFRLFFDQSIQDDIFRLLYIDSDSLVVGSLQPLLDMDMHHHPLGMIRDAFGAYQRLTMNHTYDDCIYNSGVALIDVPEWKKQNCTQKLLDQLKNVRSNYPSVDQDLLNVTFQGNIQTLPLEYNFQPLFRAYPEKVVFRNLSRPGYYTTEEVEYARQHPVILHTYRFLGDFPWHKGNYHPDTPVFDEYLRRSEWKDMVKQPAKRGIAFKIEKLMYRTFPKSLFFKIFLTYQNHSFRKQDRNLLREELKERKKE